MDKTTKGLVVGDRVKPKDERCGWLEEDTHPPFSMCLLLSQNTFMLEKKDTVAALQKSSVLIRYKVNMEC